MTTQHIHGQLRFTSTGQVIAGWVVDPLPRPRTEQEAQSVHAAHAGLWRALQGHDVLAQGLLVWTDPARIVDRMVAGIDLDACPEWDREVAARLDLITDEPIGTRRWFLHVTLPARAGRRTFLRAAFNELAAGAGLAAWPPSPAELVAYNQAAEEIGRKIPAEFNARPMSSAEQTWTIRRAAALMALDLGEPGDAPEGIPATGHWLLDPQDPERVPAPGIVLDPGALTDLDPKQRLQRLQAPFNRRVVKVIADSGESYYSCGLVLSEVPRVMGWPACEFAGRIDETGVPADLAIAMTIRPRRVAAAKNRHSMRQLNDQLDQVDGDPNPLQSGTHTHLNNAAQTLADYDAALALDAAEVEIEAVVMAAVAAGTLDQANDYAAAFIGAPMFEGFVWGRPIGAQTDIFNAMQPGGRLTSQLRDYRQLATGEMFAAIAPFTAHRLGAPKGVLAGYNTTSLLLSPWFIDLFGDIDQNRAGALVVAGDLGSGKSVLQKTLCGALVDRGGRFIATDVSATREWATFAATLGCPVATVDIGRPQRSLDPLRVLPDLVQAVPVVAGFLTTLLNISATSTEGRTLGRVLKPAYLRRHKITSMGQLRDHLAEVDLPQADRIAAGMDVFWDDSGAGSLAAAVFDPALAPLNLDARAIVIGTNSLALPTAEELAHAHLYEAMSASKIFGRAMWALLAHLVRQVCFSDPSDPALWNCDEGHATTSSPEALKSTVDFLRTGRKSNAAFVSGSHNPEADYPNETLRGLISTVVCLRNTKMAGPSARVLGFDPEVDPIQYAEMVQAISSLPNGSGAGIARDSTGQVGQVQVLLPANADRAASVLTTPHQSVGAV